MLIFQQRKKMPRTESECTSGRCDDEELLISPLWEVGVSDDPAGDAEEQTNKRAYITLRERRQIKLGLRKVCIFVF